MLPNAQPKPIAKRTLKARAQRAESRHAQQVRADVFVRDRGCRLGEPSLWLLFGPCNAVLTWAHLGANKRFKTRGMSPADRHNTPGTCILCQIHHDNYDQHRIDIQPATSRGADGPLGFQIRDTVFVEAER